MSDLNWQYTCHFADGENLSEKFAAVPQDTDLLVAGGGDGTIAAAAREAIRRGIDLAILPLGTMNIFARDLDIPLDLDGALSVVTGGTARAVDVGWIEGQLFLNSVVIGAFAKLAREREKLRKARGAAATVPHLRRMMRILFGYGLHNYDLEANGERTTVRAGTIQVTNNPLSISIRPLPVRETMTSGKLGCYIDKSRTALGFAKASVQALAGGMPNDPAITSFECSDLTITPRASSVSLSVDGEVRSVKGVFRLRSDKQALRVWGPA